MVQSHLTHWLLYANKAATGQSTRTKPTLSLFRPVRSPMARMFCIRNWRISGSGTPASQGIKSKLTLSLCRQVRYTIMCRHKTGRKKRFISETDQKLYHHC